MSTDNEDAVRAALDALLTRIDDAFDSYERFGGICKFEDEPMIHASMLTEIADLRGALHVATIAATPAHAAHAAQAELIATHEFDLDAYERLCQSKDATIKEQVGRITELEAALLGRQEEIGHLMTRVGELEVHAAQVPAPATVDRDATDVIAEQGVFKGAGGLQGLADAQEFWDAKQYGTRLYFGDGANDYLHRDVLRAAIRALKSQPVQQPGAAASSDRFDGGKCGVGGYCGNCYQPTTITAPDLCARDAAWTVSHNGKSVQADTLTGVMTLARKLRTDDEHEAAALNLSKAIDAELVEHHAEQATRDAEVREKALCEAEQTFHPMLRHMISEGQAQYRIRALRSQPAAALVASARASAAPSGSIGEDAEFVHLLAMHRVACFDPYSNVETKAVEQVQGAMIAYIDARASQIEADPRNAREPGTPTVPNGEVVPVIGVPGAAHCLPERAPEGWRSAVGKAYATLWRINNEPMAPMPMYSPERAAHDARKLLRDLLTHEERGAAINAMLAATPSPHGAENNEGVK